MYGCEKCDGGYITESEVYDTPEGGRVKLRWCSNVLCDYNVRVEIID